MNSFHIVFRSSQRKRSIEKGVLKILAKFTEKHLCQSLFLIKLQRACNFFKKGTLARVFPVNIAKFLIALLLQNTSGWLLLSVCFTHILTHKQLHYRNSCWFTAWNIKTVNVNIKITNDFRKNTISRKIDSKLCIVISNWQA